MADQDRPNQNADKSKAEGEHWRSESDTVRKADRDTNPEQQYSEDDGDNAAGITNRPLPEEVEDQERLPERGTNRDQTRDPESRRQEGDYEGSDR